jgi:hypothetical protein
MAQHRAPKSNVPTNRIYLALFTATLATVAGISFLPSYADGSPVSPVVNGHPYQVRPILNPFTEDGK